MLRPLAAVLAASLLLAPAAGAQRIHPALAAARSYRLALADLAAGGMELAVGRVDALEHEFSARCAHAVERQAAEALAGREPEAIVALAYLRLAVHQSRYQTLRAANDLHGFEELSINGMRDLVEIYVRASGRNESRSLAAGLLAYLANVIAATRGAPRVDTAGLLLADALELDPEHIAALHSLAVSLELLDRPAQALPYLERLLELDPDDARYRVRRAVVTVKAGRLDRGEELLKELRTGGAIWARDLATQELARLLVARNRAAEAETVLRQGLLELPAEKLTLQLAALLDPRWMESREALAGWIADPRRDPGPSARWIYDSGAKKEIESLRQELAAAVGDRAAGLGRALRNLPSADDERSTRAACP